MTWTKGTLQRGNFRLSIAHVKFHQICTLVSSFCWKDIKFRLKKYRGVMFHVTKDWWKIWRKTNLWFGKWHEEFSKFLPEHLKVSKLEVWWDPFIQSGICMSLNLQRSYVSCNKEWCKIWRGIDLLFQNWHHNFTKFDPSTQNFQKFTL